MAALSGIAGGLIAEKLNRKDGQVDGWHDVMGLILTCGLLPF